MSQSQAGDFAIDPYTTSGVALATILNRLHDAGITTHSGAARPAYAKAGTVWLDTSTPPGTLKWFDGTLDHPLGGGVSIGATAPIGVSAGAVWFDNATENRAFIYDGTQWVDLSPSPATDDLLKLDGSRAMTGVLDATPGIKGRVTAAAAGEIGEVKSVFLRNTADVSITQNAAAGVKLSTMPLDSQLLTLTPGIWMFSCDVQIQSPGWGSVYETNIKLHADGGLATALGAGMNFGNIDKLGNTARSLGMSVALRAAANALMDFQMIHAFPHTGQTVGPILIPAGNLLIVQTAVRVA